jgi:hypothetical protein
MQQKEIDIELQKAADSFSIDAPEAAWPFIANALHKKRKRRFLWLFFPLMIIVAGSLLLKYNSKGSTIYKSVETSTSEVTAEEKNIKLTTASVNKVIKIEPTTILKKEKNNSEVNVNDKMVSPKENNEQTINEGNVIAKNTFKSKEQKSNKNIKRKLKKEKLERKAEIEIIEVEQEKTVIATTYKSDEENTNVRENDIDLIKASNIKLDFTSISTKEKEIVRTALHNNFTKKIEKNKPTKRWNYYYGINLAQLNINDKNFLLNNNKEESISSFTLSQNPIVLGKANYSDGKSISTFILAEQKNNKKIQGQFGIQLNYNQFKSKVFSVAPASILDASGILRIDSNAVGNSQFSDKALNGGSALSIKNYNIQLGFIAGAKFSLIKINKNQSINIQVQCIPTFNVLQSINWFDKSSSRYFTEKKLNKNFSINQSTSILWEINKNRKSILVGPSFNVNIFKLNKTVTNLSNLYTNSIGLQVQLKLK